jgi:hypothetical protein
MKKLCWPIVMILMASIAFNGPAWSKQTRVEKIESVADNAVNASKKAYRKAKDKTCELINGEMKCLPAKIRNKSQTAAEHLKSKAKEKKNKID